ncbi:radical SAM protein [Streptomyces jumonjinensis]|uniref:radical SAM protein n=2 Tax=Streptomyces jumonjinensis TaxID=1945 RepID=UPI0033196626
MDREAERTAGNMAIRDVVFVQFSDRLLTPIDIMRRYYRYAYSAMPGYVLPPHYMEIPFWIPLISGMLPDELYRKSLHIATDQDELIRLAQATDEDTVFLFSVLETNLRYVKDFVSRVRRPTVLGGYTDPAEFSGHDHVRYLGGLDELGSQFPGVRRSATPDYRLFAGDHVIPRFSLSSGCSFRCNFCSVPTQLTLTPVDRVAENAEAYRPLSFELVYVDDKSFGEARNWRSLGDVGRRISAYNPGFLGFIVQTPPSLACRDGFIQECWDMGVRYIEFGLEICDDRWLAHLRKPFRMRHVEQAMELATAAGMKVVPNLIFGIPGADYTGTVDWISRNAAHIPAVNVNWLAVHQGNERGGLGLPHREQGNSDEHSDRKTWLSESERDHGWQAIRRIYAATAPGFPVEPLVTADMSGH